MAFLGSLDFVEGRSVIKTATMVLERCLSGGKRDDGKAMNDFFKDLKMHPDAFFRDIDGDWCGRPFLGEHAFKMMLAAGYEGTEHDLWNTVMGYDAPYLVKVPKALRSAKGAADAATAASTATVASAILQRRKAKTKTKPTK